MASSIMGASSVAESMMDQTLAENTSIRSPRDGLTGGVRSSGNHGAQLTFMRELERIQKENIKFTLKLEKEKSRKAYLDEHLEVATQQFRDAQKKTRDGVIVKENDQLFRKQVALLEQKLEATKVKISVTRVNNQTLMQKIMGLRKEKMMQLEIFHALEARLINSKEKVESAKREAATINDKKQRTQMMIASLKSKMLKEVNDFSHDLSVAKSSVYAAQGTVLNNIRGKLLMTMEMSQTLKSSPQSTYGTGPGSPCFTADRGRHSRKGGPGQTTSRGQFDLDAILNEVGVQSLEELVRTLQKAEDVMFVMYNDMQEKHMEAEKLELENKKLEDQLSIADSEVLSMERNNEKMRSDLEDQIRTTEALVATSKDDCEKSTEVLKTMSDCAMNLLRNIALEEEAVDVQILSTGVTDRNVHQFLGLVEDRIDALIQMKKATIHQDLKRDDFTLKTLMDDRNALFEGRGALRAPTNIPSLEGVALSPHKDDENDAERVVPLNIQKMREYMARKAAKQTKKIMNRSMSRGMSQMSLMSSGSVASIGSKYSVRSGNEKTHFKGVTGAGRKPKQR